MSIADPLACAQLDGSGHPLSSARDGLEVRPLCFVDLPGVREEEEPDVQRIVGVRMRFAARPGVTREWLSRSVRCFQRDAERNAADPLLVADSQVDISSYEGQFTIDISSEDRGVAGRIQESAQLFLEQTDVKPVATASVR